MTHVVSGEGVVTAAGRIGDAIAIEGGRVVAVGSRSELVDRATVEDRFPGAWIIPGLRDSHFHAVPYAALLAGCSLKSARSIDELVARVTDHASGLGRDEPVIATRFDDEHLAEHRLPTRHDLDRAVPDRPAVIYRYCGHIAVANTAALAASGITAATADPEGGSFDRDETGTPTGVLRETASGRIAPALARGGAMDPDRFISALTGLAGLGITSIGAMIGYGESPAEKLEAELALWSEVGHRLPIRVHGFAITDDPSTLAHAKRVLDAAGPRMRWLGVKRFADGSLGGHTAAMHDPFADLDTTGTMRLTDADAAVSRSAVALGGMVAIHAIGDRAVDGVLDLFDALIADGANPGDLRMEHVSIISPDQVARFREVGVGAVVQPAFLASESDWVVGRVGENREGWVYPFRSMLAAGIPLAASSDCPVEPPHPFLGMAAAVDRCGVVWDEAVDPLVALGMFTDGAARALREPPPLAPGSPADFVVVDRDPASCDADRLRGTTVIDTWVDGVPVEVDRTAPVWED